MHKQSLGLKFISTSNYDVKHGCIVFLLLLTVKVLIYIGDLVPAFRRREFLLQVFMADFNSFRSGKYEVIDSFVSEESYEKYSIIAFVS